MALGWRKDLWWGTPDCLLLLVEDVCGNWTRLHAFTDVSSLGRKQSYCGLEIESCLVKIRF